MKNAVFGKTMENVRKYSYIKLAKLMKKDINLVLRPNYQTTKCFSKNLLAVELQKTSKNR